MFIFLLFLCISMTMRADADVPLSLINIRMTGTVVRTGCAVDPLDVNKSVSLGSWSTKSLNKTGATTSPISFSIHLLECTVNGVTISFSGKKDEIDPDFLALNNNTESVGVAIQIMDNKGKRIPMGEQAPRGLVDEEGSVVLNFLVNYIATADNSAKPGNADADTEFTLTYD